MVVATLEKVLCHIQEVGEDLSGDEAAQVGEVSVRDVIADRLKYTNAGLTFVDLWVWLFVRHRGLSYPLEFEEVHVTVAEERASECQALRAPSGELARLQPLPAHLPLLTCRAHSDGFTLLDETVKLGEHSLIIHARHTRAAPLRSRTIERLITGQTIRSKVGRQSQSTMAGDSTERAQTAGVRRGSTPNRPDRSACPSARHSPRRTQPLKGRDGAASNIAPEAIRRLFSVDAPNPMIARLTAIADSLGLELVPREHQVI